jgi:hypothetical protein
MAQLLNTVNVIDYNTRYERELTIASTHIEMKLRDELVGKFVEYVGFENRPGPTKWFLFQEVARTVEFTSAGKIEINGHTVLDGKVEVA